MDLRSDNGFQPTHFLTEGSDNGNCEKHSCVVPSQRQDHDQTMRNLGLSVQLHGFR